MGYAIAIDGPAGAGKSTIAKLVAKKLDLTYVDTGAMYRAVAYYICNNGIDVDDLDSVEAACGKIDINITYEEGTQQVILNGDNITGHLREEEVGKMASRAAKIGAVRSKLVELQRNLASKGRIIMDGRDIGTCVLPGADFKIFLTASVEVRADRRYKELTEKGIECDKEVIKKDIADRDYEDMHRELNPLTRADDAYDVDTSDMTIEETVDAIISICEGKNV